MKHIFIVNPHAGKENVSQKIRTYLAGRKDLEALVFNTEYRGHETELVERFCHIFEDEPIRLYICGGSGTLCRAVSGIKNLSMVEVAFFPCGMTNDYLKMFNGEVAAFTNLEALINGVPLLMDVVDFGFGKSLNFTASGFEAKVANDVNDMASLSIVGQKVPYFFAIIRNLFATISSPYTITVDGKDMSGKYAMVTSLNGNVYGGYFQPIPSASPVDGKFEAIFYEASSMFSIIFNIGAYTRGELDKIGKSIHTMKASEMTIRLSKDKKHYFTSDGEVFEVASSDNSYTLRLLPAALKLIVPQGVSLKDECKGEE
ncbi:MAG TPA: diacylglycerol kinase family protein [Bacillota bacterium]|nr:diacylglycerol kinase family protein [Bacillota bacterium]